MANSRPILSDGPRRHGKLIGRCPPDRHTNKETTHGHTHEAQKWPMGQPGQTGAKVKVVGGKDDAGSMGCRARHESPNFRR